MHYRLVVRHMLSDTLAMQALIDVKMLVDNVSQKYVGQPVTYHTHQSMITQLMIVLKPIGKAYGLHCHLQDITKNWFASSLKFDVAFIYDEMPF